MARKSRWQQFADSFNAMYGTVTEAGKNIESAKVLKQDFTDDAGQPLAGSDLDRARARALADIYTKYGDAEGGIALRSNAAALEASEFENSINREVRPDLVAQRGALKSGLMGSQINSNNASAANSAANANRTNVLLPYEAENYGLRNEGLGLTNEYDRRTMSSRVLNQRAIADRAAADARSAGAGADVDEASVDADIRAREAAANDAENVAAISGVTADLALSSRDEAVAATIAKLEAEAEEARTRITTAQTEREAALQTDHARSVVNEIIAEVAGNLGDFESNEEATAHIIDRLTTADISPEARLAYAKTINQYGLERLGAEAMATKSKFEKALKEGGLPGAVDAFIDTTSRDGYVQENDDGTVSVLVEDENGAVTEFARGDINFVTGMVADFVADPMNMMEVAASALDYKQKGADLEQTEADIDETTARTGLYEVQTENVATDTDRQKLVQQLKTLEIKAAERAATGKLSFAEKQAMVAEYLSSAQYSELLMQNAAMALDMRATYEAAVGHPDAPPPEVMDLQAWYGLSKAKQEEWRRELEKLNAQ